ncbi:AraC family transcriptional regulator [Limosilactobacillus oris]
MNQIAKKLGFNDNYYFSKTFKKCKGIAPLKFRYKHQ